MSNRIHKSFVFLAVLLTALLNICYASEYKIERAKKALKSELDLAKNNYDKEVVKAKKKMELVYKDVLSEAMKNADLELANKISAELKTFLDDMENIELASDELKKPKQVPEGSLYFNKNWYHFYDSQMSFSDAKSYANKSRGRLLVISSSEENKFIIENFKKKNIWLDLSYIPPAKRKKEKGSKKLGKFGDMLNDNSKGKTAWKVMGKFKPPYLNWRPGYPKKSKASNPSYAYISKSNKGEWVTFTAKGKKQVKSFVVVEYGSEKKFLGEDNNNTLSKK